MKLIDNINNINNLLGDDIKQTVPPGVRLKKDGEPRNPKP